MNFLGGFSKNLQKQNSMTIRLVGTKLLHADGRTDTDMTKLIVACHNFANAP